MFSQNVLNIRPEAYSSCNWLLQLNFALWTDLSAKKFAFWVAVFGSAWLCGTVRTVRSYPNDNNFVATRIRFSFGRKVWHKAGFNLHLLRSPFKQCSICFVGLKCSVGLSRDLKNNKKHCPCLCHALCALINWIPCTLNLLAVCCGDRCGAGSCSWIF